MTCIRISGPGRTRGFVCTDEGLAVDPNPDCPNSAKHTPSPTGYVAGSVWAGRMLRTHIQRACEGCGLWVIWIPKVAGRG